MPINHFSPEPGRYGTHIITAVAHAGGGHTIANGTTTILPFQGLPAKAYRVETLRIQAIIAGVDSGTLTLQVFKRNAAGTEVALTAATSLETDYLTGTLPKLHTLAYAAAVVESDRNLDPETGDHLIARVVSQTTVSTQPNVVVSAELALRR